MKSFNKNTLKNVSKSLYTQLLLISMLVGFVIEIFSRHSLFKAFSHVIDNPIAYTCNVLIIFLTLTIVPLFRRRLLAKLIISTLWIAFGITNGVVLSFRVTPFTANDLGLITSTFSIINKYLNTFEIIIIGAGIIAAIAGLIYAGLKCKKFTGEISYKKSFAGILVASLALLVTFELGLATGKLASFFPNIAFAYTDYGFPYCFSNTLLNTGIHKPENYSEETIKNIFKSELTNNEDGNITLLSNSDKADSSNPNIIMVQLESFFDPTVIKGLELSGDPVPNFRNLLENYSSGYVHVPSIGAGTANTEFEVLTGMNLEFFGPGEYPYKTILQKTTSESVSYNLKEDGYSTHAIHNNKGTFYDRRFIFSQLGFDTFTSLEYMDIREETPNGWAIDAPLADQIMETLDSTENEDFVYTITVQSHGVYPTEPTLENPEILVNNLIDVENKYAYEYYINQLYEVDKFIGDLVDKLSKIDEDVVLVLFGDHLPTLNFKDEDLTNGSIFKTDYVIWDNMNLPKVDKDMQAYQLSSYVLEMLDKDTGVINKFHQEFSDNDDYLANLKLLQYDMLYGNKYIFDGNNPYIASELKMGIKDIAITSAYIEDNNLIVKGNNFTPSSTVYIDNHKMETIFQDYSTLIVEDVEIDDLEPIVVKQITSGGGLMSATEELIFEAPTDEETAE